MPAVVLLTPIAAPGGAERALARLAARLPDHGWTPHVVSLAHGPALEYFEAAGAPITVIDAGRLRQPTRAYRAIRQVAELIEATEAPAIVSNQTRGHIYGGLAARRAGAAEIWWQHGIPTGDRLERIAARVPAAAAVAGSTEAVTAQVRLMSTVPVHKIPPGTDLAQVRAARGTGSQRRAESGWTDDDVVVGIVGRLQPWKGQHVFLEAAAKIADAHPQVRFALIGGEVLGFEEAGYADRLAALTTDPSLAGKVKMVGHVDDPYPWFDALDVAVHASVHEPFGLVIVEAMALGTVIVAADSGGPAEIIEPDRSGLLYRTGDADALASALENVLGDDALRARLSTGAAVRADAFSDELATEKWVKVLDSVAFDHDA